MSALPQTSASATGWDRVTSAVLGLPALAVLGVAAWLEPAAKGYGTHRQLGLGECSLLDWTGMPCPMCGMTTTFAHLAHGHLLQGLVTQPFGVVLFAVTLGVAGVALVEGAQPRGRWRQLARWLGRHELPIAAGLLAGLILGWIYKIVMMKILVSP